MAGLQPIMGWFENRKRARGEKDIILYCHQVLPNHKSSVERGGETGEEGEREGGW